MSEYEGADGSASVERSRDLERLLTFVDAIVAIAITLLVLPLAELAGEVGEDEPVWHVVAQHLGQVIAFLLSFVVIARLWYAQHRIVRSARGARADTAACLIGWSLTIVFLPFPTALLAATGAQAATKILYIGTLAVSAAALGVLAWVIGRREPGPDAPHVAPALWDTGALLVALVLSLAVPALLYWPLLLLYVAGFIEPRVRRQREPTQAGSA